MDLMLQAPGQEVCLCAMRLIPVQEVAGTCRAGVPCSLPAVLACLSSGTGIAGGGSSLGNACVGSIYLFSAMV